MTYLMIRLATSAPISLQRDYLQLWFPIHAVAHGDLKRYQQVQDAAHNCHRKAHILCRKSLAETQKLPLTLLAWRNNATSLLI